MLNAAAHHHEQDDLGLMQLLHDELDWLYVQVTFNLEVVVHRCLNNRASQYLADCCTPLRIQRHLRSAKRILLHVPRHDSATHFTIVGPSAWNSLPDPDRNPNATEAAYRCLLKHFGSHSTAALSALGSF